MWSSFSCSCNASAGFDWYKQQPAVIYYETWEIMDSKPSSSSLLYFHHLLRPTVCFLVGKLRQQKKENKSQLSYWKIAVLVKVGWCEIENDWNELRHHLWVQLFPVPLSCQEAVTFMWCPVQIPQGCQKSDPSPGYIHRECETRNKEALRDGGKEIVLVVNPVRLPCHKGVRVTSTLSLSQVRRGLSGTCAPASPRGPHHSAAFPTLLTLFSTQLWSLHLAVTKSECPSGSTGVTPKKLTPTGRALAGT